SKFGVKRVKKGHGVVERDFARERSAPAFITLNSGHLIAPFEHGMRGVPLPDLVRVDDECAPIPEADRLAHPARELLIFGCMSCAVGLNPAHLRRDEHVAQDDDLIWPDQKLLRSINAPNKAIRETECRSPPMPAFSFCLHLLNIIFPILRC